MYFGTYLHIVLMNLSERTHVLACISERTHVLACISGLTRVLACISGRTHALYWRVFLDCTQIVLACI